MSALPPPVAAPARPTRRVWLLVLTVVAVVALAIAGVGAWHATHQPCHRLSGDEVLNGVASGKYTTPYPVAGKCAP